VTNIVHVVVTIFVSESFCPEMYDEIYTNEIFINFKKSLKNFEDHCRNIN